MAGIYYPKSADNWTICNVYYLWRNRQQYNLTLIASGFYPSIRLNNHHCIRLLRGCEIRDKKEEEVALAEIHRIQFLDLSPRGDNGGAGSSSLKLYSKMGKFRRIIDTPGPPAQPRNTPVPAESDYRIAC